MTDDQIKRLASKIAHYCTGDGLISVRVIEIMIKNMIRENLHKEIA